MAHPAIRGQPSQTSVWEVSRKRAARVFGGTASPDRRGTKAAFTFGLPILSSSANYTGPDVYGGYESILFDTGSGNVLANNSLVETSTTNVSLRVGFNRASTVGAAGSGMFFFLTDGSGISFDSSSSLSLTTGSVGGTMAVRWLVNDGGVFYVSSSTFASTAGTTTNLNDPNSITWQVYSPTATRLNFDQSVAASAHTFANILAAGVYFEDDAIPNGTGLYTSMDLLKFSVEAVPEPDVGFLALAASVLCCFRGRR
jgi:hypothetical protein